MRYSLDTSALLEAWRRSYPRDVFPSLWEKLEGLISTGDLRATEEVFFELERQDDEVLDWAKENPSLFIEIDDAIQRDVQSILEKFPRLVDTRKSRSGADPFVIALALGRRSTVVTNERASGSPDRPHIPDVCTALGIRCITILELIREQGWVFRGG